MNTLRRLSIHVRLFAWRWHRRLVAQELEENEIYRDGPLRISFFCAWGPFKSEYVVWRICPRIGRARIYGNRLLFGQAAQVIRDFAHNGPRNGATDNRTAAQTWT